MNFNEKLELKRIEAEYKCTIEALIRNTLKQHYIITLVAKARKIEDNDILAFFK